MVEDSPLAGLLLSKLSIEYRKKILPRIHNKNPPAHGKGFSFYWTVGTLPSKYFSNKDGALDLLKYMRGLGLPVEGWIEEIVEEAFEMDTGTVAYPYFYLILEGVPCRHWALGGCTMCGYNSVSWTAPPHVGWKNFLNSPYASLLRHPHVKFATITTRGSFFDEVEIDQHLRKEILRKAINDFKIFPTVETRADIILENWYTFTDLISSIGAEKITIAVGVESALDEVLKCSVNKNEDFKTVEKALIKLSRHSKVLAFVFTPKPFLNMEENLYELYYTLKKMKELGIPVVLFRLSIHRASIVELLARAGRFKPVSIPTFVKIMASMPDSVLKNVVFIQNVPMVPGPKSLIKEPFNVQDIKDIYRYMITYDKNYLYRILNRHNTDVFEIPKKRPWDDREICRRVERMVHNLKEYLKKI